MKAIVRFVFAPTLVVLTGISAEAGLPVTQPVVISQSPNGTGTVSGALGSTRNGSGTLQYLGTWAQIGYPDLQFPNGVDAEELAGGVVAKNASGSLSTSCAFPLSSMKSYLPQLAVMNSDSSLSVGYEPATNGDPNSDGRCNIVGNLYPAISQCCSSLTVNSFSYNQRK